MIGVTVLIALFGLVLAPLFVAGTTGVGRHDDRGI